VPIVAFVTKEKIMQTAVKKRIRVIHDEPVSDIQKDEPSRQWLKRHGIILDAHDFPPAPQEVKGKRKVPYLFLFEAFLLAAFLFSSYAFFQVKNDNRFLSEKILSSEAANLHLQQSIRGLKVINEVQWAEMRLMNEQLKRLARKARSASRREAIFEAIEGAYQSEIKNIRNRYDDEVKKLLAEISEKGSEIENLRFQLESSQGVLVTAGSLAEADTSRGVVMAVNHRYKFILINLGQMHGVELNQMVEIYQNGSLIGHGQVERVYPELAGVGLLEPATSEQIHEGDEIYLQMKESF